MGMGMDGLNGSVTLDSPRRTSIERSAFTPRCSAHVSNGRPNARSSSMSVRSGWRSRRGRIRDTTSTSRSAPDPDLADDVIAQFESCGVPVDGPHGHGTGASQCSCSLTDPDGYRIEIECHYPTVERVIAVLERDFDKRQARARSIPRRRCASRGSASTWRRRSDCVVA